MNKKEKKELAKLVTTELEKMYPQAACALEYRGDPWKLMVMARLSAQCTDKRVNEVCEILFSQYPSAKSLSEANIEDVEKIVKPCGLYRRKASDIIDESVKLCSEFDGILPSDIDTLLTFPGVGRKIANLLIGDIYGQPAIVTDTHFIRICGRLGLYPEEEKNPHKIEKITKELIEPTRQSDFCHRIVMFGRDVCFARAPRCGECPIGKTGFCSHAEKAKKTKKAERPKNKNKNRKQD